LIVQTCASIKLTASLMTPPLRTLVYFTAIANLVAAARSLRMHHARAPSPTRRPSISEVLGRQFVPSLVLGCCGWPSPYL
jgi:hypothetical protein